jgi:hypothetical protein
MVSYPYGTDRYEMFYPWTDVELRRGGGVIFENILVNEGPPSACNF